MALQDLSASDALSLLKENVGSPIKLAVKYMAHDAGSEWRIKSVNMLGGTCVIAVVPLDGAGKGFFAPYKTFLFDGVAPAAPVQSVADAAKGTASGVRNEFTIDGFDAGDPVYEVFAAVAPDSDAARELFMTYVTEHSEYDTEPLDDLMKAANVLPGVWWKDTNVTQMLLILGETQASVDEDDAPEPAPEPVVEAPAPEPAPKPAIFIHPDVKSSLADTDPVAPKRRGRPPGSKNAKAEQPAIRTVEEPVLAAALDNLPPAKDAHYSDYLDAGTPENPESEVREVKPKAVATLLPSPLALSLAAQILPSVGADDAPDQLLDQIVGVVRRALLLD